MCGATDGLANMKAGATTAGGTGVTCNSKTDAWLLASRLKSDTTKWYCADSTGKAGETTASVGTGAYVCP